MEDQMQYFMKIFLMLFMLWTKWIVYENYAFFFISYAIEIIIFISFIYF